MVTRHRISYCPVKLARVINIIMIIGVIPFEWDLSQSQCYGLAKMAMACFVNMAASMSKLSISFHFNFTKHLCDDFDLC